MCSEVVAKSGRTAGFFGSRWAGSFQRASALTVSPLSRAASACLRNRSATEIVDVAGVSAPVGDATANATGGAEGATEGSGAGATPGAATAGGPGRGRPLD